MNPFAFFTYEFSKNLALAKAKLYKSSLDWLKLRYDKLDLKLTENLPYNSLAPISDADIGNDYQKALDWALRNRKEKNIRNIALTGPYGSGKSSILNTYIKNCQAADLRFLNISLATFKEETPGETKKHDELMRLIELSILQQIFYKEADDKIPDSRFKRIKSISRKGLWLITCSVILFSISIVYLISPDILKEFFNDSLSTSNVTILRYISLFLVIIGGFIFIYKSIRTIQSVKIDKLNIHSAEIKINDKVDKSILNHHLDEILYFFEVAKYSVVVIEDLDRFQQTEIFTKLREINLLINNSEKIKENVVFIYAVRDDMFTGSNERTKFFDFIIPVIPVINPSNSGEKLLEKRIAHNFNISDNLIGNVSLFVDDMRLVHNIFNEYYLYHQKLNKGLDQDKLLSIIVYKNLFPDDFVKLSNNTGVLYAALNSRLNYINSVNSLLDQQMEALKLEIKHLEEVVIKDVKELRFMYLLFYSTSLPGFVSFRIGTINKTPVEMAEEDNFNHLVNGTAKYMYNSYGSSTNTTIPLQFTNIEKSVDNNYTYAERVKQIKDIQDGRINTLKQKIADLQKEKLNNRGKRISELIDKANIEIEVEQGKQKQLLSVLLRNGYINEDYLDYVSIFYEGSLSKSDHQFLINVKTKVASEFDFKLDKISNLIRKIDPLDFEREYALNFALVDFLLTNEGYTSTQEHLFKKLADGSATSTAFIDQYIDRSIAIGSFIKILTTTWRDLWKAIEANSTLTDERKEEYFKLLMRYAEVEDLNRIKTTFHSLQTRMEKHPDILNFIDDTARIKQIIKDLSLTLREIKFEDSPGELLDFVYEGNFYALNIHMVSSYFQRNTNTTGTDFNTKNYYAIIQAGGKMLQYINDNINLYVQNIYLKIPENISEEITPLVQLLNHEKLSIENKVALINQVQTKVNDLEIINEIAVRKLLLKESKVLATWENLISFYSSNESQFGDELYAFLEADGNAAELSKQKISDDVKSEEGKNAVRNAFTNELLLSDDISDKTYDLLLGSISWRYEDLAISSLSEEKLLMLIKRDKLVFTPSMFKAIRHDFINMHIKFIEANFEDFIEVVANCELNTEDVKLVLLSSKLSNEQKQKALNAVSEELYINTSEIKRIMADLILQGDFQVSEAVLKSILVNQFITVQHRIKVFNMLNDKVPNNYFDTFLTELGDPYSEITIRNKRPLLDDTKFNLKLVEVLRGRNYISNFDYDKKGIRVYTFRKDDES